MNGEYALDTNITIAFLNGDQGVAQRIAQATSVFIPIISLGELYFGAYASQAVQKNLQKIQQLPTHLLELKIDRTPADRYGLLKADLKRLGRPIPENDLWIAALSMQHRLTLASRDQHFAQVSGLAWEQW